MLLFFLLEPIRELDGRDNSMWWYKIRINLCRVFACTLNSAHVYRRIYLLTLIALIVCVCVSCVSFHQTNIRYVTVLEWTPNEIFDWILFWEKLPFLSHFEPKKNLIKTVHPKKNSIIEIHSNSFIFLCDYALHYIAYSQWNIDCNTHSVHFGWGVMTMWIIQNGEREWENEQVFNWQFLFFTRDFCQPDSFNHLIDL